MSEKRKARISGADTIVEDPNDRSACPERRRGIPAPYGATAMGTRQSIDSPKERGMILLILLFLAATILIGAAAASLRLMTQGRRQREQELVWRGEQYVRAIRLYYRRFGQFPKTFEDFNKNPGNLHFLRKQYKDPMNSSDGTWRYIYVSPTGQLMGSLTRSLPIGMVALGPPAGTAGASFGGPGANPLGAAFPSTGAPLPGGTGAGAMGAGGLGPSSIGGGQGGNTQGQPSGGLSTQPAPATSSGLIPVSEIPTGSPEDLGGAGSLGPGPVQPPKKAIQGAQTLDSPVIGGQLVGIGSKVDHRSILFYKGYGKYREWEFIWDPAQDVAAPGGLPPGGGILPTGIGGAPPANPPGQGIQPPGNPPPQPPQ